MLWPFKLRWEGDYSWSVIERFFISYKVHTKMLSGHLVRFSALDGKKVPVAEFTKTRVAAALVTSLRQITGVRTNG